MTTILLVEDDPGVRTLVRVLLKRQGYKVLVAKDGAEALRYAAAGGSSIDMLLTDVVMPSMSGPELALRLSAEMPALRVVFMSGYHDHPECTADVRQSFIAKPFTARALCAAINAARPFRADTERPLEERDAIVAP